MRTVSDRQFDEHCKNGDGICEECFTVNEGWEMSKKRLCRVCGCKGVMPFDDAVICGVVGIMEGVG